MRLSVSAVLAALTLPALAACQTTDGPHFNKLDGYLGRTMADFSGETTWTPGDAYEAGGLRVFVVDVGFPGRIYPCRMLLTTKPTGTRSGADAWTIVGWRTSGGCDQLQS